MLDHDEEIRARAILAAAIVFQGKHTLSADVDVDDPSTIEALGRTNSSIVVLASSFASYIDDNVAGISKQFILREAD